MHAKETDHKLILVAGDCHGNPYHAEYLFQVALDHDADAIVQVGDYGFWTHYDDGAFLDLCSDLATQNNLPLYWIDGNHENFDGLFADYGPGGPLHELTPEGFWRIRDGIYYIPRGTRWSWSGAELMGLGGAYSIDNQPRREEEARILKEYREGECTGRIEKLGRLLESGKHVSWWPQEQLTDADVDRALATLKPIDVLFTQDKPRNSKPGWKRRILALALPNQDKIQRVVDKLKPRLLIHGHLHHAYEDLMKGYDYATQVVSLNCDLSPERVSSDVVINYYSPELVTYPEVAARLEESWILLDLDRVKSYNP